MLASQPRLQKLTALEVWYEMNTNTVAKKNKHERQIFKRAFGITAPTRNSLTDEADVKLYRNLESLGEVLWAGSLSLDIIIMAPSILFTTELTQRYDHTTKFNFRSTFLFYQLYNLQHKINIPVVKDEGYEKNLRKSNESDFSAVFFISRSHWILTYLTSSIIGWWFLLGLFARAIFFL